MNIAENIERVQGRTAKAASKGGRLFLLWLIIWLTSPCALASMWMDPDWEEMLKGSELIALVEVIEGGTFVAKVRTLTTFKGSAATEFYVTGFNNHNWPAEAIKIESFKEKDRYYLFANRREDDVDYLEFLASPGRRVVGALAGFIIPGFSGRSSNASSSAALKAARKGLLWSVWTPTAGELPVQGEKVQYSLLRTSYPRHGPMRDRSEFEEFLKAAVAYHRDTQPTAVLLDKALQTVRGEATKPLDPRDSAKAPQSEQGSDLSHWLATYYLLGGRTYDAVFETIGASQDVNARFILARLLGSIHDERAGQLLLVMLKDGSSVVQGEVVRQLARGDPKQMGPVLLARLGGAGEGGVGPQNLMDPVRNCLDGGKIEIIRALGELKYEPAAPALIALLEKAESGYDLQVMASALEKMGNWDYAHALEKSLWSGKIRVYDIAYWAGEHRLTHLKPAFERYLQAPPQGTRTIDLSSIANALGVIGDDATAAQLTAYLEKLNAKKMPEVHDEDLTASVIGALAALRYKPARSVIQQSFFYWFGIDSTFAANPELLRIKRRLERKIERKAVWGLGFRMVWPQALVFLENRDELTGASATEPKYRFVLNADVFSWEPSNEKAKSLRSELVKSYPRYEGRIGVSLWNFGHTIFPSGENDERVSYRNRSTFLWRYGQYVQATGDPQDLRFAKFLMESGLAESWDAQGGLAEGLESTSLP